MDEFGRLAGEVAAHARGTIAHWEIVNEPDAGWAFSGTAEDYARMLRAAHDAIKSRVPEARVVMGGIAAPHDPGWIGRMLATPGARAAHAFDIANVHLRGSAAGVAGQLASWRDLLARHGFGGPVWVTEHGYAGDPAHQSDVAFRGGEPAQAAYLTQSLLGLGEAGASEVFVTLRDNLDGAFASEGVVDVEEAPGHAARRKPAFAAVRRLVDRWDELIAARAAQRRHEASAGVETERALAWERAARAARPALAQARARLRALRARYARARRAPVRARLAREVARATKRVIRRKAHVGWPKAVAADYWLRAALHSRRAFDLAVWVARG
jgi:hypothetical protein